MAPKKIFFFLPARSVTRAVLCYYLIDSLLVIATTLTDSWGANYKEFLKENAYLLYVSLFIALIGVMIYSTAGISISNDKPSIPLLCTVSAFLLLQTIYSLYIGYLYTGKLLDTVIEGQVSELPLSSQDSARSAIKDKHSRVLTSLWALQVIDVFIVPFALLVIEKYIDELRENLNDVLVQRNINFENSNFYGFPTLNGLQYFIPPGGVLLVVPYQRRDVQFDK